MPQQIVHMSLFFQSSLANVSISKQVKWKNCKMASKPLRSSLGSEIKFCYLSLLLCSSAPLLSPVLTDCSCLCFCLPNEAFACRVTIFFVLQVYQSNVMSKCWVTLSPGEKTCTDPLTLSEKWQIAWTAELALHVVCSMASINGTEKNINSASSLTKWWFIFFPLSIFLCCLMCWYHQNLLLNEMPGVWANLCCVLMTEKC